MAADLLPWARSRVCKQRADELMSLATIELMKAAERYDASKGPWAAYAQLSVSRSQQTVFLDPMGVPYERYNRPERRVVAARNEGTGTVADIAARTSESIPKTASILNQLASRNTIYLTDDRRTTTDEDPQSLLEEAEAAKHQNRSLTRLSRAIQQLPPVERAAIVEVFLQGRSPAIVAGEVGVASSTLRRTVPRALDALREILAYNDPTLDQPALSDRIAALIQQQRPAATTTPPAVAPPGHIIEPTR